MRNRRGDSVVGGDVVATDGHRLVVRMADVAVAVLDHDAADYYRGISAQGGPKRQRPSPVWAEAGNGLGSAEGRVGRGPKATPDHSNHN